MMNMNNNCPCNNDMNDNDVNYVTGNMPVMDEMDNDRNNCGNREELLHQIMAYDFAINELALYLDTHADDEKALCLHNRYCKECKELKDKYQKIYGPLTIEYPCNKWRWLEEPWPWERGNF